MPEIKIASFEVIPFVNFNKQEHPKNEMDSPFLRWAINQLYNRVKGTLKHQELLTDVFHNHDEKTQQTIVRYPLIQFIARENRFFITCLNEGCDAMKALAEYFDNPVVIDKELFISFVKEPPVTLDIQVHSDMHRYWLTNYLPFNSDTYPQYQKARLLTEKIELLTGQLYKHIVKDFGKHLGLNLEGIKIEIADVDSFTRGCVQLPVNKRKRDYQPFDIVFEANANLPEDICLGIGKAYGYGLLKFEL